MNYLYLNLYRDQACRFPWRSANGSMTSTITTSAGSPSRNLPTSLASPALRCSASSGEIVRTSLHVLHRVFQDSCRKPDSPSCSSFSNVIPMPFCMNTLPNSSKLWPGSHSPDHPHSSAPTQPDTKKTDISLPSCSKKTGNRLG